VWEVISTELFRIHLLCGVEIHAFVLMANHYHMLLTTPDRDLGVVMSEFGGSVTRTMNRISGRSGHLFGGPYRWSQIRSANYYANALKYVYRNPVRAGIVARVEDYPFSTLDGLLGGSRLPVPLYNPRPECQGISFVPEQIEDLLEWFNEPFRKEIQELLDKGFRRRVFALPRDPRNLKAVELEMPTL
jgi:putative transposase